MNAQAVRGLVVLAPACLLVSGSTVSYVREKSLTGLLQLLGASFLTIVGICHLFEAFQLLPQIGWGLKYSLGHYIDFWSAALGLTLFPVGYLLDALLKRRA